MVGCLKFPGRLTLGLAGLALALSGHEWVNAQTKDGVIPATTSPSKERALSLPDTAYRYANVDLPAHFKTAAARRFDNTPANNPVTDAGATLGRVLFYDTRLSANNTVACASCHHQKNAFADPNRYSKGFDGRLTDRHAPSLVDSRYYQRGRFFWDERAKTLEDQVLMPIQSKLEMGQTLSKVLEVVTQDANYPALFQRAFPDKKITKDLLAKALAQFVRSMVSYQSKFDVGMSKVNAIGDDFPNFTAQENRGKNLFVQRCSTCHLTGGQSAHFFMNRPMNNGLDANVKTTDGGLGDISLSPAQLGLFKSPSLRNIEFTAAYMHDGRFGTLDAVIDHYSRGVKQHPNLDPRIGRARNIDATQKAALIAFLKTLSDNQFIADPKFSDPFQTR
jgi:cytochrome c peroxidase